MTLPLYGDLIVENYSTMENDAEIAMEFLEL